MTEKNVAVAEAFYKAMNVRDLDMMKRYLHPDVQFVGPLAEMAGREDVLNGYRHFLTLFEDLTIRAKFGSGNQAMLAYDLNFPKPIGNVRTAVLMTFKDNLIASIEVFCDGRPLVRS